MKVARAGSDDGGGDGDDDVDKECSASCLFTPLFISSCVRKTLPGSFYAGEQNLEWRERSFEERNGAVDKICIIMHK